MLDALTPPVRFALAAVALGLAWAAFGRGPRPGEPDRRRPWLIWATAFGCAWLVLAGEGTAFLISKHARWWLPTVAAGVVGSWFVLRGRRGTRAGRRWAAPAVILMAAAPFLSRANEVLSVQYELGPALFPSLQILGREPDRLRRAVRGRGSAGRRLPRRRGVAGSDRTRPVRPGGPAMTYGQEAFAFAATRLPVMIGVGLLFVTAARRWRDDRAVAGWLIVAGATLLTAMIGQIPVEHDYGRGGMWVIPLGERLFEGTWFDRRGTDWGTYLLLALAAACGLAAAFWRRAPAAAPGDPAEGSEP